LRKRISFPDAKISAWLCCQTADASTADSLIAAVLQTWSQIILRYDVVRLYLDHLAMVADLAEVGVVHRFFDTFLNDVGVLIGVLTGKDGK